MIGVKSPAMPHHDELEYKQDGFPPLSTRKASQQKDSIDPLRQRAIDLFRYLSALVELRSKMIRDCESYENLFWFSELPKEPECFTAAWPNGEDEDDGVWLKIERPRCPQVPQPPYVCQPWLDEASLADASRQPSLRDEIDGSQGSESEENESEDQEAAAEKRLRLADHPEVFEAWQAYLEDEWVPWSENYRRWQRVQAAYGRLFAMYQMQRRRGEQFELVLGVGTLVWKSSSGHRVCRPVLCGRALITLEPHSGSISVTAAPEGAAFRLEQDMLEVEERPPVTDQQLYDKQVALLDSPWDRRRVFELLRGWVHSLPCPDGQFLESLACPETAGTRPQVAFSPVLMLRKRSGQTLQVALQNTIQQLAEGGPIPQGIREACGDYAAEAQTAGVHSESRPTLPDEVLFPLPTNDEQKSILYRLNGRPAIVVQGPPGTGKSHTTANLISHFLAHGKRVLVTSQTPRALKVLQAKIPAGIRPLCLSLLGNDTESLRNLEASVQGILREIDAWNPDECTREIERVRRERHAGLSRLAELRRHERAIAEGETLPQRVPNTIYTGTAQTIAQQLEREADELGWLEDDPPELGSPPLTTGELDELVGLWAVSDMKLLDFGMPDVKRLPRPDEFQRAVKRYEDSERKVTLIGGRGQKTRVRDLSALGDEELSSLQNTANHFTGLLAGLTQRTEPWVRRAVDEILSGVTLAWQSLASCTDQALTKLQTDGDILEPTDFVLPSDVTQEEMLCDVRDLLSHLRAGQGLGFLCFRAPVVKRTRYLWRDFRFAGRLCDSVPVLADLADYLERLSVLSNAWQEWSACATPGPGGFRHRLAKLRECQRVLQELLELNNLAAATEADLSRRGITSGQPAGKQWAVQLSEQIDAANAIRQRTAARADLEQISKPILEAASIPNLHPAMIRLAVAAKVKDFAMYRDAFSVAERLAERRNVARRCRELDQRLRRSAPLLADALQNPDTRVEFLRRLPSFSQAWQWKLARGWLERGGEAANAEAVASEIPAVEDRVAALTERLVELLAWQSCHRDLSGNFEKQGALQAWQLIVRRIGRGSGKHVETLRRDARKYMDECKAVIPAWIMPLHRVAETVAVQGGAFDVVIIDEASQTGPEGLMLQYLGKQCIVVGDDKQISPEAVGVNVDNVRALMEQFLDDIPFAETLTPTSSLFDQAIVRYGGNRIMLREHFRCMPEIIRFSNDLCYHDTPLLPLREYPPQRLEPILVRHVVDGYREGGANRVINRPEAAAVVKTVIDCLNDPRYAGKSMGVICLQGQAQAQLIEKMLLDAVGPEPFEERHLICGDPYSFQGDERDVVFLSMVAASEGDGRSAALVRESYRQRFNVAVSRAKDQMWLFHSISAHELHPDCMRRRLLEYCYHPRTQSLPQDLSLCESEFEREVATELANAGYRVIPQYPAAGKRIDLVVEGTKARLAVECDGDKWHGADRYEADMARQRMLERCGWKFVRVRGSSFYANRQREIARIVKQLDSLDIMPIGRSPDEDATLWIEDISGQQCIESMRSGGVSQFQDALQERKTNSIETADSCGGTEVPTEPTESMESAIQTDAAENVPPDAASTIDEAVPKDIAVGDDSPTASTLTDELDLDAAARLQVPNASDENDRIIRDVVGFGYVMWMRLSRWGKENETLNRRERKFVYDVGRHIRQQWPLTIRQARWAATILEEATQNGFDMHAPE
jgi:very-short-patch-repair endonuclease